MAEHVTYTWEIPTDQLFVELPRDPRWDTPEGRQAIADEVTWLEYKHGVLNRMRPCVPLAEERQEAADG